MNKIMIYLKSGNSFKMKVESLTLKHTGENITELKWEGSDPRLMFIDLTQIEAVIELS